MNSRQHLYPNRFNPLLVKPDRLLPREVAIIGSGTIGPDIGYYLKSAISGLKLFIVDVVDEPLKNAEKESTIIFRKRSIKNGWMKTGPGRCGRIWCLPPIIR